MLRITFRSRALLLFLCLIIAPLPVVRATPAAAAWGSPWGLLDRVLDEIIKGETRKEPAPANPQTDQPAPSQNETNWVTPLPLPFEERPGELPDAPLPHDKLKDSKTWFHAEDSPWHKGDWESPQHGFKKSDKYAVDLNLPGGGHGGRDVKAVAAGKVVKRIDGSGYIEIEHTSKLVTDSDVVNLHTQEKWYSGYMHMKNITVAEGETVAAGGVIGHIGNTSPTKVPVHLHFAVYDADGYSFSPYVLSSRYKLINYGGYSTAYVEADQEKFEKKPTLAYRNNKEKKAADSDTFDMDKLMKVEVIKEGAPLRAEPSPAGTEVCQTARIKNGVQYGDNVFFVDPTLIPSKDGSKPKWFKVLFDRGLSQINKSRYSLEENYSFIFLYIDASHVRETQMDAWDKDRIEYFKQGRPPLFAVGDSLAKVKKMAKRADIAFRGATTISPMTLYKEPKENAATFTLPKGSKIIDPNDIMSIYRNNVWGSGAIKSMAVTGLYRDMNEESWTAIFDSKSQKIIGWNRHFEWASAINEPTQ